MLGSKQESDKMKAVFSEQKSSIKAGEMEQLVKTGAIEAWRPEFVSQNPFKVEEEN